MSIIVKIIGDSDGSDEYLAAEKLKGIIQSSAPEKAFGEIILFPSATLFGMPVKDIDIMMIGHLHNCKEHLSYNENGCTQEDDISIESFCTTIEVKAHSTRFIRREGTNLLVKYAKGWHNATRQSNEQKFSAKTFFDNYLGGSPYITNLLWFTEVPAEDLRVILSFDGTEVASNALPSNFTFKDLAQKLVLQRSPRFLIFDCNFGGRTSTDYVKPLQYFSKAKETIGTLTRKKIEQITHAELSRQNYILDDKLTILRGKAGTGKTIDLIRMAVKLVDEEGARVQILTYNRALVSDIRRLLALASLPDMFDPACVAINTMQSYFYGLINGCLYDGSLKGESFLERYPDLLKEMIEFLKEDSSSKELVQALCEDDPRLNWEYVLIDEAQDWSEEEMELILLLYDKSHLWVADGGRQFVRTINPCDWTQVRERKNYKLKNCLRQKRNLVKFINQYASSIDQSFNKITTSENMVGGRIIIIKDRSALYSQLKSELKEVKKAGNEAYDMLFLSPSSLVVKDNDNNKSFALTTEFEQMGILLWDGINDDRRIDYSINLDEARVLQYESSRGLEGWTVCCLDFDVFMRMKEEQYDPSRAGNALLLESAAEQKKKYLLNWALIPMTRAIDTLILVLRDQHSSFSKSILECANHLPDYVQVI